MVEAIVLDNVVLSAFQRVGWFNSLEHWCDDYDVLTPKRIWDEEFLPVNDIENSPEWLEVYPVESKVSPENPGRLSDYDWSCIVSAEERDGSIVTRDQALRSVSKKRDIEAMWLGRFIIETYEGCGISVSSFENNLDTYFEDSYEPEEVRRTIRNAEKR